METYTTSEDFNFWIHHQYPVSIAKDRYSGTYSGAIWTAWPLEAPPSEPWEDDVTAMMFWAEYKQPVGRGNSPMEALKSLEDRMKTSYRQLRSFESKVQGQ